MQFADKSYTSNHYVTRANAEFRAKYVENVNYDVTLAIPKGEHYFGHVIATFSLKEVPEKSLGLDFRGIKISNLNINGQDIKNEAGEG